MSVAIHCKCNMGVARLMQGLGETAPATSSKKKVAETTDSAEATGSDCTALRPTRKMQFITDR